MINNMMILKINKNISFLFLNHKCRLCKWIFRLIECLFLLFILWSYYIVHIIKLFITFFMICSNIFRSLDLFIIIIWYLFRILVKIIRNFIILIFFIVNFKILFVTYIFFFIIVHSFIIWNEFLIIRLISIRKTLIL